jgi:GT2 family glycosyltransferase
MKVFAIIVTYNGMKWIQECLNSVLNSSIPIEIIVIDNCSMDGTSNFIQLNFPMVSVLSQTENLGFGVANNIGINHAVKNGADAVFLLNQDAFVQKNCIQNLVEAYQQNRDFGIISPIHLNGNGSALDHSFQKVSYMSSLLSDLVVGQYSQKIYEINFINAAAWFIPKQVLLTVGGFDPLFFLYGEDDNYCQRVLYHGFKIGIIPNATIFHDSDNNNYEEGYPGSDKYYRQFLNSIYIKYANVNTDNFKKLKKLKIYLFRKALGKLFVFKIDSALLSLEKFKKVNNGAITQSVKRNKVSNSNYLDF